MSDWLANMPRTWDRIDPRRHFAERREPSKLADEHLTPSQHYGVLPQAEYMKRTGSKVVLNLTGADNMKHVETGDFIAHLRSFQGGLELARQPGKVSMAYTVVRPLQSTVCSYYRWVLKSSAWVSQLAAASQQLRDGQSVKFDDFAKILLPMPSAEEQRRIADFLDDRVARIDQIIAARRSQKLLLRMLSHSSLAAVALEGLSRIPLRRLITDERLGLWGDEPGASDADVQVARVADFDRDHFRVGAVPTIRSAPRTHVASRLLEPGDVLLERSGGTPVNPVGCPAYVGELEGPMVSSNFVSRLKPASGVDGRYLSLVMGALYATRQQEPHSTQTTGIQNLNTGSYFTTTVPQRTSAEQRELGREMDASVEATSARRAQIADSAQRLTEYKQSLITSAVTGEFDVTTASTRVPGE